MEARRIRSVAPDLGLFLIVSLLLNAAMAWNSQTAASLTTTWYIVLFIHLWFTLYDGEFSPWRKWTWVLLIVCWAETEVRHFGSYLLPWGQLAFWLADQMPWLEPVVDYLNSTGAVVQYLVPLILASILGLDIAVMHSARWRRRSYRKIGMFLTLACVAAIALGWILASFAGEAISSQTSQAPYRPFVVPYWYELWLLSLLRAIPGKMLALLVTLAALFIPAIWPWVRADSVRTGQFHRVWLLLCWGLAIAWGCLTYQGSGPPDEVTNRGILALVLYYFSFFLIMPFALRRMMRKEAISSQPR